jgi:hypothetical protein
MSSLFNFDTQICLIGIINKSHREENQTNDIS